MNLLTRLQLRLTKKKLPVYWGNEHWYDYANCITRYGKVLRFSPNWIDYKSLPDGETSKLLSDEHPHGKYRQRFHNELRELILSNIQPVPKNQRVCLFTSGGTASGKTSAIDELVEKRASINVDGGLRIDYDRLKKLLPEYDLMISLGIKEAAKYVQSESAKLGAKLFKKAFSLGVPIIFEQTLENSKMPLEYTKDMKRKGYDVVVAATHVTEEIGQQRAADRAKKSGRYVSPEIISKIYAGVPKALFELRTKVDQIYLFDNCGDSLQLMFVRDNANGPQIINPALYEMYLNRVGSDLDLSL